jgi:hypothetical protein
VFHGAYEENRQMAETPDPIEVRGPEPGLATSPISDEKADAVETDDCKVCYWNGQAYSRGARVCNRDVRPSELLECREMNGKMQWVRRGMC